MSLHGGGRRIVIGVGNEYRRDDGFGPHVIAVLTDRQTADPGLSGVELHTTDGEPTRLLNLWTGAQLAVLVDVVRADHAGDRYELVLDDGDALDTPPSASSHAVSLGSTVALGWVLGRLPSRLVVLAVSGTEFGFGTGLTPQVAAAVPAVVQRTCELVRS